MLWRKRKYTRNNTRIDPQTLLPAKTKVVLYTILIALIIVAVRTWHLTVIEHENKSEEARRPQKRTIIEPAKRGTIRDRFNLPLAINKIHYQATVIYSQILQVPAVRWEIQDGKKIKRFKRKEYIRHLAQLLAQELDLDPDRLEDLIHSKAALYHQVPFLIKDNITEKEYYKLKILEKDLIGLHVRRQPHRHYPQGRIASDIIGYMGSINRNEYEKVLTEIRTLEAYVKLRDEGETPPLPDGIEDAESARARLLDLQEKAYTINDYVGKMGVEGKYEQQLRGFQGTRSYATDARGNFVTELPGGREPLPGQRLLLTISAELQAYAEEILVINEKIRQARITTSGSLEKSTVAEKQPWMKGGAIIAIEPHTGEILALASHPRYDPNDFVGFGQSRRNITRWFETESYLADIWEQRRPLEKEIYNNKTNSIEEYSLWMTWESYLDFVLPYQGPLRQAMETIHTIQDALAIQNGSENSLKTLEKDYDKNLIKDITLLAVNGETFDPDLIDACGHITLAEHHDHCCIYAQLRDIVKDECKKIHHQTHYRTWRTSNEKEFLKTKRAEEKQQKRYPKPYIDLLDAEEKRQFDTFWQEHSHNIMAAYLIGEWGASEPDENLDAFLDHIKTLRGSLQLSPKAQELLIPFQQTLGNLSPENAYAYIGTLRAYNDLNKPLLGKYRRVRKQQNTQLQKHLAIAFYPIYGYGYGRSQAYRQSTTQGSIFKLITAYAGMNAHIQKHPNSDINPLTLYDNWYKANNQVIVAQHEDRTPIPRLYKGGRLPKSVNKNIGKVDVVKALAHSSNPYFSLIAGDVLESPDDLAEAARLFSYGSPTGIDLPGEIGGNIPTDLNTNRTGLYAMAIGQHSLVVTPLQAAVMLSTIANGGKVLQPKIVRLIAGRKPQRTSNVSSPTQFSYQESLNLAGIDIPLFSAVAQRDKQHHVEIIPSHMHHEAFMPQAVREVLMVGMQQVVEKTHQVSLKFLKRLYRQHPDAIKDYQDLRYDLIGKTSTAESVEALDLEMPTQSLIYNHLWFGGILLQPQHEQHYLFKDKFGKPELVVVIYLRYGGYGKETTPIAAQIAQKWRAIKSRNTLISEQ